MASTGKRRFTEVILLIARKNGKTTFIAGIDLAEFFLSKGGVDIVCASNTNDQASILFEEINNMREQSKSLSKPHRSKKNIFYIYSPKTKNKIKKLSAQSRNLDGFNIEVGCIDEVHEMPDSKVYDAIKQSQSTKEEPLIFIITTEGKCVGGFLDNKLDYCRKMIKGEIEDEHILPWLYTQDSEREIFEDPSSWQKSNPSLGAVKTYAYLEDIMNKSKNDLATRVTMLCKDFNIKQLEAGSWLIFDGLGSSTTGVEDFSDAFEFNMGGAIGTAIEMFDHFFSWLSDAFNNFISWLSDIGSAIGDWFNGVVDSFTNWINDGIESIGNWLTDTWDSVVNWCSDAVDTVGGWITDAWDGVSNWFNDAVDTVGGWFSDVGDWFSDTFNLGGGSSSTTTNNNQTTNTTNNVTINTTSSEFDVDSINKALGGNYL